MSRDGDWQGIGRTEAFSLGPLIHCENQFVHNLCARCADCIDAKSRRPGRNFHGGKHLFEMLFVLRLLCWIVGGGIQTTIRTSQVRANGG
jgi:hypothetical protein